MCIRMTINKRIGKDVIPFEVSGETLYDVVMQSQKLSFPDVTSCGCCGSDNLILEAHLAQGKYKYVSIKCKKCKASVTFGVRAEDNTTYFLRRKDDGSLDWKPYEGKNANNNI